LIRTSGKEKNYELIEYVNDVNRQYAETLMELNENGYLDTAYTYGNERLSADRFEGSSYYYLYEGRGSVSAVTGTDGYFTASYRYNAYGEMTFGHPQYENVYSYNGESYNPNLDGQYLRARYYHVKAANFFTEDSYLGNIREPLSLNRYNYVYSSYLNYIDSRGRNATQIIQSGYEISMDLSQLDGPYPFGDIIGVGILAGSLIIGGTYAVLEGLRSSINQAKSKSKSEKCDSNEADTEENKETTKTNLGNEIDISPKEQHEKVTKNPGPYGEKNSSVDIVDENGDVKTRRWYDENGHAYRDVDMINHGNPKQHPEWPHEHIWDWSSGNGIRK
jgi:RHS repeat-associated protein